MSVAVKSQVRVYKHIEVKAARAEIHGEADQDFVSLHIAGMQFKGDKDVFGGYFYDNWTLPELKELADGLYEFLRVHEKGAKLIAKSPDPKCGRCAGSGMICLNTANGAWIDCPRCHDRSVTVDAPPAAGVQP